jgi:anthranilate phosphoribosyltransferase
VALVCAAAGVTVAKHGNRAMSSRTGAADVLEALGVRIDLAPERVVQCIDTVGIGFLFAQAFHPAMKHAAAARRELGVRTVFNLLGPLSNPAGATHQLVGVFAERWVEPLAAALGRLGARRALVVHGLDGADELSLCGPTAVAELNAGAVRSYRVEPATFGLSPCHLAALAVDDAAASARAIRAVLGGEAGPRADIVALNAGAALYAAEAAASIDAGLAAAREVLASGRALRTLEALVEFTRA